MGRLVTQQFVSVDGFAADSHGGMEFMDRIAGDSSEFDAANRRWLEAVSSIVLGRTTYEQFASYWPTSASDDEVVAARINELPKVIVSSTLESAPWGAYAPCTVIREPDRLRDVIERSEGDVVVWGSLTLCEHVFALGLVDTVRLVVVPQAIGAGRNPFPRTPVRLDLTSSETFAGGIVELQYEVVDA